MIFCENVPQCLCGHVFSFWKELIKASQLEDVFFQLQCPSCKRDLQVKKKQKLEFEVHNSKEEYENRATVDNELIKWSYVGERNDGTFYIASVFDSEEQVKSFCEINKFVPVAIGSFKITFKSIDREKYKKERGW